MADPKTVPTPAQAVLPAPQASPPPEKTSAAPLPPPINPGPKTAVNAAKTRDFSTVPFWLGLALSLAWVVMVAAALVSSGEGGSFGGIPLVNWAIGLSAIASPVALIWMITAYLQRASDVQVMTEPLRKQLNLIIGENNVAEARIKRFNAAIREQLDLLRQGSTIGEEEMVKLLRQLSWEREEVKKIAMHRMAQLHEAGKITHAAEMFDTMLANKLQLVQEIEEKLRHGNGILSKNTDALRTVLGDVLNEIKDGQKSLANSLTAVKSDSQELRDHLKGQEVDILNAQNSLRAVLGKSEQEFDALLGRFYDRAKDVEEAMDDATSALTERIDVLETASNVLPGKIAAAAEQLNAAIANYATIEETAARVTAKTSRTLDEHVQALDGKIEGFAARIEGDTAKLADQRQALSAMLDRITAATGNVHADLMGSANSLTEATESSLARFQAISAQVKAEAFTLTGQLRAATEDYAATAQQTAAATELQQLRFGALQEQVSENLLLLKDFDSQAAGTGDSVLQRSRLTLQQMQQMEERLHGLNSTVALAGEQTQRRLQTQMEAQQALLKELGQAATASASTLQQATEKLGGQHDGLVDRATRSEAQLQKLVLELAQLQETGNARYEQQLKILSGGLRETGELLRAAELQLQDFNQRSLAPVTQAAAAITTAAAESSASIAAFSSRLDEQAAKIGSFEQQVSQANTTLEATATKSSSVIGTLLSSLLNLGRQQDDLTTKVVQNFEQTQAKLGSGMTTLSQQAGQLSAQLGETGANLTDQSQALATSLLSHDEALQTRVQVLSTLQDAQVKQHAEQLAALNRQITTSGDALAAAEIKLQSFSSNALIPVTQAAQQIHAAAAQGEASIAGFGAKLDEQADKFAAFEDRVQQTNAALEAATARSNTSIGTFIANLLNLGKQQETLQQKVESGVQQASQKLSTTLTQLGDETDATAARLSEAHEKISAQSRTFITATAEAELQFREQTRQIGLLHSEQNLRYAQHIATLNQGLNDTATLLDATEQRIEGFGANALGPVNRALVGLNDVAAQGASSVRQLTDGLKAETEALSAYESRIDTINLSLETQTAKSSQTIGGFIANLFNLGQKQDVLAQHIEQSVTDVTTKLNDTIDSVGKQASAAVGQIATTQEQLTAQQRTWLAETDKAETALQERLQQAQQQTQAQSTLYAQQLATLNTQIAASGDVIAAAEGKLQSFSSSALAPVTQAAQQIQAAAAQGEANIAGFGARLEEQAGKFAAFEQRVQQTNAVLEETASRSSTSIGTLIANLINLNGKQDELAQKVEARIDTTGTRLHAALSGLEEHADSAAERLAVAAGDIGTTSKNLLRNAADAEDRLQTHAETLSQLHTEQKAQFGEHLTQINLGLHETTAALAQTADKLEGFYGAALSPVRDAARQIQDAAEKGSAGINSFADTLSQRAEQMSALQDRFANANAIADSATARHSEVLAAMLGQIATLNQQQDALAQRVETAFGSVADRLAATVGNLSNQATLATDALDQTAQRLSSRTEALGSKAIDAATALEVSSQKIENRSTSLGALLENQLGHIAQQLAAFELRFTNTGDLVKEKAQAAATLIGETGVRFGGLATEFSDTVEGNIQKLQALVGAGVAQIGQLGSALQDRLQQIGDGNADIQMVAAQLADANDRIIAQLSRLHSEGTQAGRLLQDNVSASMTQIAAAHGTFSQQQIALQHTTERVVNDLARAGSGIAEHAERLNSISTTHDTQIKLLQNSLDELEGKSTSLRDAMSQHSTQLLGELRQGIAALQTMGQEMQTSVNVALAGAGTAQSHLAEITQHSTAELQERLAQMQGMGAVVEQAMGALRGGVQEQMATLQDVVQQITTQQGTLKQATAAQRDELLALFGQLAQAHQSASTAAEQSIAGLGAVTAAASKSLADFSDVAANTLQTVANAGDGFGNKTDQMVAHSRDAAEQVRQIMDVTESLADHARGLTAQTQREADRLAADMASILRALDDGSGQLADQTKGLLSQISTSSTIVTAQIADAVNNLQQCGDQVRSQMAAQTAALRDEARRESDLLMSGVQSLVARIDDSGRVMHGRAQDILQTIEQSGDQIMGQVTFLLDKIAANNAEIRAQMAVEAEQMRAQAFAEANQMAAAFGHVLHDIDKSGDKLRLQADSILSQIGDQKTLIAADLADALQQLSGGGVAMRDQMRVHIGALRDQALAEATLYGDKITELLSDVTQKGGTLQQQTQVISAAIEANREKIAQQFAGLLAQVDGKNQAVFDRIGSHCLALQKKAEDENERFSTSLTHLLGQIDGSIGHLRFQSEDVLARIAQSGTQVKRDFAQVLGSIAENQTQIKTELTAYATTLREQAQRDMAQIMGDISAMLERIDGTGAQLREHVVEAVGSLDLGGDALAQQVEVLLARINDNHTLIRSRMTEHATQMRDEYAGEVARVADGLRAVMTDMQQAGVQLRAQNSDVIANLEHSALRFAQSARQASQYLADEVTKLDGAANQVETRLQVLGKHLQTEQQALTGASNAITEHTVQLAAQTAAAADRLQQLLRATAEGSTQAQGLSNHVAGQLQGMIIHLREEMQRLVEHSASTAEAANSVVTQIAAGTEHLRSAGADMRREGNALPQIVALAEERLVRAGTLLREHAADAAGLLEHSTGTFVEVFSGQQDMMAHETQRLQAVAEQAGSLLQHFGHQLAAQLGNLQRGTGVIEVAQQKLVDQTAAAIAHLGLASDRLNSLREGAETAQAQMVGKMQHMDGQAQATAKVLTVGSQTLAHSIGQLAEISSKAQEQMMGAGTHYRTQLEDLRQGIAQQLGGLHEHVAQAALQLEQKASVLNHVSTKAEQDIEQLLARFNAIANSSSALVADKTAALHKLAEDAAQLLLGFGKTIDAQLEHLASASEHIGTTQKYLSGTLDHSIHQVDVLQEKMEHSRAIAQTSTVDVAEQLQKLSNTLQLHIEQLGQGTQHAVGLVEGAGAQWQGQAQNLARIAQQARSELAAISYAIDALQQKGGSLRDTIRGQGDHLMKSLSDVVDHMAAAQDDIASDDPLVNRMERGLQKIN
jgi:hypothetical protein